MVGRQSDYPALFNEVRLSGGPHARQPHNTCTTSVALTSQLPPKTPGRRGRGSARAFPPQAPHLADHDRDRPQRKHAQHD